MALLVAFFLVVILGMVSPKMITATVIMAVAIQVCLSFPAIRMTATVPREEQAMLTRLLPIRMAPRASSKWPAI